MLAAVLLMVLGSTLATVLYALHLRSAAYRLEVAADVSRHLGMCVQIAQVEPRSRTSRAFRDVKVSLSETGPEVFACTRALWSEEEQGGKPCYVLRLEDGWLLVGTQAWTTREYERMLAGGLGHDFRALGLSEVRLSNFDLRFQHPLMEFRAGSASGVILFDDDGIGHAALNCTRLNRVDVTRPVNIAGVFTPGSTLVFHEVRLTVPPMPLSALGLDSLLPAPVTQGTFAGNVTYRQDNGDETVLVAGSLQDARLEELTGTLEGGPYRGRVALELDRALFERRKLHSFDLHGQLSAVRISDLVPELAGETDQARLELALHQMRWREGRVAYLSATGSCTNLELESLAGLLAAGRITGTVTVLIRALHVVDDRLERAEIEVIAEPPADGPGVIERDTLAFVARKLLGLELQVFLPREVEYTKLGVRLEYQDGKLRVGGTHGADNAMILTVRVWDREFGIIRAPQRTFDVPDPWVLLQERASKVDVDEVRAWWEELRREEPELP